MDVRLVVHPETNATMYDLVSTQLYHDHPQVFDVLENIVIMAVIPIFTFVVVVVATTATVVQLKRVIDWRQKVSSNVDGTEVSTGTATTATTSFSSCRCSSSPCSCSSSKLPLLSGAVM